VGNTVCRVAVHASTDGGCTDVDLTLPAGCPTGTLLPSIVDAVHGRDAEQVDGTWHLSRVGGAALDPSRTLGDNGIRDGDLLLLAPLGLPPPRRRVVDPCRAVTEPAPVPPVVAGVAPALLLLAAATAAGWAGRHSGSLITVAAAAAVCVVAAVQAVTSRRAWLPEIASPAFAVVAAVVAVPDDLWPSTSLLAASAALAVSLTVARALSGPSVVLIAAAAVAATVCAVAAGALAVPVAPPTAGAVLTVAAVAGLSAAPTLAAAMSGLTPGRIGADDGRAARGHLVLTGLVAGWAATAALGVTVGAGAGGSMAAVVFALDVAALLALRARSHADPVRRASLRYAGMTAGAAALLGAAHHAPAIATWLSLGVAAGLLAVPRLPALSANPLRLRALEVAECVTLAAAIPLAVWVSGGFAALRSLSLV
jgi:type VII secretion integral membrane protein EccD